MFKPCTSIFFYPYTLLLFGGILVLTDIETVYVNKDFKLKITNSVSDIYSTAHC